MFPYPILSDNSEAQHSSISIYIPSAGRSFMLEFLCWSSKDIWFGAFQIALVIRSSAVRISLSRRDLFWFEGGSELWEDHGSWFRFAGCWWWYHGGFFQTTAGVRSDHGRFIFWTFLGSFDFLGGFCLLLCLCIILTWNPIDYLNWPLLLVVHQRIYCFCISSLCL